jgi:hypothetical protein
MLSFASKYQKFWKCFNANEDEVFNFEADQERVFDKLAAQLQRVHSSLTFEFSSVTDGMREFVISAGGLKEAFPEVVALGPRCSGASAMGSYRFSSEKRNAVNSVWRQDCAA